jgi:predicted RNase H-like HicB family nuclease
MRLPIETEREVDDRWIAEVIEFPGVMVYGKSRWDAIRRVKALALRVVAEGREA